MSPSSSSSSTSISAGVGTAPGQGGIMAVSSLGTDTVHGTASAPATAVPHQIEQQEGWVVDNYGKNTTGGQQASTTEGEDTEEEWQRQWQLEEKHWEQLQELEWQAACQRQGISKSDQDNLGQPQQSGTGAQQQQQQQQQPSEISEATAFSFDAPPFESPSQDPPASAMLSQNPPPPPLYPPTWSAPPPPSLPLSPLPIPSPQQQPIPQQQQHQHQQQQQQQQQQQVQRQQLPPLDLGQTAAYSFEAPFFESPSQDPPGSAM
eukprot:1162067-Pelagomonas_calceolata.AAC.15